jgi:deoxyadenosine/deoxycytidine kinase
MGATQSMQCFSPSHTSKPNHIIISLDGNIGSGKSTLLAEIRAKLHDVHVVEEPVGPWTALKNEKGENLLGLFYGDKRRWGYTFQNCAILTRLKSIKAAVDNLEQHQSGSSGPHVIITERSVLTDKHVFAEMLRDSGDIDQLEWELYENWFNIFHTQHQTSGIIYVSTGSQTSKDRIHIRNRPEEENIEMSYLEALDAQHKKWIGSTSLPVLTISTERDSSVEENLEKIREFIKTLKGL